MTRSLLVPLVGFGLAAMAGPIAAQNQPYSGAFAREYPQAAELVNGFHAAQASLLERLYTNPHIPAQELEGSVFAQLVEQMKDGEDDARPMAPAMPRFAADARNLAQVFDLTHALQLEIYDIYADARVADKHAAAEAAIDRYLARSDVALSPTKKSMTTMDDMGHDMHAMHGTPGEGFEATFPKTNGLLWASDWLQLALFDPMMYYDEPAQREDGVEKTIERFYELVDGPPETTPQEMPTPAAVTPELVRLHPRAAAIFHNLHMLQDEVTSVLANHSIADKRLGMTEAYEMFRDPTHMTVSDYDWIVLSLRNGIFYQGGPAIGRLDRPERNMTHAHTAVMPGMGAPGGAPAMPPSDDDQGGAQHQH